MQVRTETSPEDVGGMHAATGILTARGGMTSHAAVVARGWGKCCVSGCSEVRVNDLEKVNLLLGLFSIVRLYQCSYGFGFNYACRLWPLGTQFSERENGSH